MEFRVLVVKSSKMIIINVHQSFFFLFHSLCVMMIPVNWSSWFEVNKTVCTLIVFFIPLRNIKTTNLLFRNIKKYLLHKEIEQRIFYNFSYWISLNCINIFIADLSGHSINISKHF